MNNAMSLVTDLNGTVTGSSSLARAVCGNLSIVGQQISEILREGRTLLSSLETGPIRLQTTLLPTNQLIEAEAHRLDLATGPQVLITLHPVRTETTPGAVTRDKASTSRIQNVVNFKIDQAPPRSRIDLSEYAPQGLLLLTDEFDFKYANRALLELAGRNADELAGRGWLACLHADDIATLTERVRLGDSRSDTSNNHYRIVSPLGATTWVRASIRQVNMPEEPDARYLIAFDDIDADKKRADRHMYQAMQDTVTGLPNRLRFEQQISQHLSQPTGVRSIVALLYIDLDGFKPVNDIYGHSSGDDVLVEVANRLRGESSRAALVARLGGDEFVVLLTDVRRTDEVKYVADKINRSLAAPYQVQGDTVSLSCSIGIALHHKMLDDRRSVDRIVGDMLRRADSAMYQAKHNGKNQYHIFGNDRTSQDTGTAARLVKDVYTAIEHNDLFMEYQPQVDTATNNIVGYEGLVRWQHPVNGLVPPNEFIPLIESTGAMSELTTWITRRVCFDYSKNLTANSSLVRPTVSINLSAIQLQDRKILRIIDNIIRNEQVNPADVVFEITESALISDPVAGCNGLEWLRDCGYKIALDDFGTGYSSLSYLNKFPIDELKLDCSFICDIESNQDSRTLVSGIIQLAHNLDLTVTAEGVEDAAQLEFLGLQDCDRWQGFLMSRAQSPLCIEQLRSAN